MPRNNPTSEQQQNSMTPPAPGNALALLDDDIRADLLRAQRDQISTFQQLPRIKVMGAGAGLFEFAIDQTTQREFSGIILNSHQRNILWEPDSVREQATAEDGKQRPACSSLDGKYGTPRAGFRHVMLHGAEATGDERIECAGCRYNKWRSAGLIDPNPRNPKGKAVTNQRALYVLLEGYEAPMQLIISPSSLKDYDAYLAALSTQNIPVQAVLTRFTQEVKGAGANRYGVVKFKNAGMLDGDTFNHMLQKRREYERHITPPDASEDYHMEDDDLPAPPADDDEEMPF